MKKIDSLQKTLFSAEAKLQQGAAVFDILSNLCRLELVLALLVSPQLCSGELAQVTNCTPSAISQTLGQMKRLGLVHVHRSGLYKVYSLDTKHPFLAPIIPYLLTLISR